MAFLRILGLMMVTLFTNAMACESFPYSSPWQNAYNRDWTIAHKQYLCMPFETLHDQVCQQFFVAYLNYRAGNLEVAQSIFKEVDEMVRLSLDD